MQDGLSHLKRLEVEFLSESRSPFLTSQAEDWKVRLEDINYCGSLSNKQLLALFTAIGENNILKLKRLTLPNRDFSKVPSDVLAAALVKLEHTNILQHLTPDHVSSLFTKIAESPTTWFGAGGVV